MCSRSAGGGIPARNASGIRLGAPRGDALFIQRLRRRHRFSFGIGAGGKLIHEEPLFARADVRGVTARWWRPKAASSTSNGVTVAAPVATQSGKASVGSRVHVLGPDSGMTGTVTWWNERLSICASSHFSAPSRSVTDLQAALKAAASIAPEISLPGDYPWRLASPRNSGLGAAFRNRSSSAWVRNAVIPLERSWAWAVGRNDPPSSPQSSARGGGLQTVRQPPHRARTCRLQMREVMSHQRHEPAP